MKIFVINGLPRSGKDTFVELCQKHCLWCLNVSTVDFVKDVANFCGWDGNKDAKNRKFLSDLKDLLTEWNDVPFTKVCKKIALFEGEMKMYDFDPNKDGVVFIHCREPKEIKRFVKELNAFSLLIRRPAVEGNEQSNHADAEVFNYDYDFTIVNDGTIEDLEEKAFNFLISVDIKNLK